MTDIRSAKATLERFRAEVRTDLNGLCNGLRIKLGLIEADGRLHPRWQGTLRSIFRRLFVR